MIIFPNINPVIASIGPLAISWYSLSYVVGILLGQFYANQIVDKFVPSITKKDLENFVIWAVIGIVVGGRLGYVIAYNPAKYFTEPIEIFKTYEGGMSFHGGITGLILSAYFFTKKYNIRFLTLTDILAAVAPIGLFLGRIANFINAELYGKVTDVPWGVIFPYSDGAPRHPSQLYEALCEGLIIFFVMNRLVFHYQSLKINGKNSAIFLLLYSTFRIIIENYREPDVSVGFIMNFITMGQILSAPMFFLGLYLLMRRKL